MFTIDTYRQVLIKTLETVRDIPQNDTEGMPIHITFTEEEMRVINVLVEEDEMDILSVQNNSAGSRFSTSGRLIPDGNLTIEIDSPDGNLVNKLEERLNDLDTWNKEYSDVFGDVSDGRTVETGRYQSFVSYGSGLITFRGKPVILQKREAYLLAHFIRSAGQLVYATEIIDDYYTGESNDRPMTICSKIISPLNNKLADITHEKNAIKTVDAQEGYILDLD